MIVPVTPSEAVGFVRERHYTGSASPGVARYGWRVDGELVGVTIYDTSVHSVRTGVFGPDHYRHVLHHHRLAVEEGMPTGTASEFIGAALRQLRTDRPEVWAVVTYADECEGHVGTIYQATNALYTGVSARGNLKFRTPDGVLKPTQSVKGTWPERRAEAARLGWTEVRCRGKHRYVYLLGTGRQIRKRPPLLWPVLPYPKKES